MRIFHLNTEKTFRGGEVQTVLLAGELQKRGHENFIIAQNNSPLAEKTRIAQLPTFELSMKGEWDLLSAYAIRKKIRLYQPDLLHAHTPHACSLALLARWNRFGVPIVFSRRLHAPIHENLKFQNVNAILAVSPSLRNLLVETFPAERVFVAESATDFSTLDPGTPASEARARLNIPEEAFVIGNVNQFDIHKGQHLLLRAFLEFAKQKNRPCHLLLTGDGPMLQECRSIAANSPMAEQISFTGRRSDLQNIYPAMDVFFFSSLPSAREGWPGVLREAMGMGIPCIAVRTPATEEFITDGKTGLLVSPDQTQEWIQAQNTLFDNSQLRSTLAVNARPFARQFTPQHLADRTEACYSAVLRSYPNPKGRKE